MKNGDYSHYKSLLQNLRPLICDDKRQNNRALLLYFIEKYNLHYTVTSGGPFPSQRSLQSYLNEEIRVNYQDMTLSEFIHKFASQDASHADKTMSGFLRDGESTFFGGIPANIRQAMCIAKPVIDIGLLVLEDVKKA
jgi:hypothetical protein